MSGGKTFIVGKHSIGSSRLQHCAITHSFLCHFKLCHADAIHHLNSVKVTDNQLDLWDLSHSVLSYIDVIDSRLILTL